MNKVLSVFDWKVKGVEITYLTIVTKVMNVTWTLTVTKALALSVICWIREIPFAVLFQERLYQG